MENTKLTANEIKAMNGIIHSDYRSRGSVVGDAVWSWSANTFDSKRSFAGAIASLSKKGFVVTSGSGEDACLQITQAGFDAFQAQTAMEATAPIVEQAQPAITEETNATEDGIMAKDKKLTVELSYPEKELLKAILTNDYQDGPDVIDTPVWAWSIDCFETPRVLESTAKHLANKGFITVDGETSAKETSISITKAGFLALYADDPESVEGMAEMVKASIKATKLLLKDLPNGLPEAPAKEEKPAKAEKAAKPAKETKPAPEPKPAKKAKAAPEPKERKPYEHKTPRLFKNSIKCCKCRKENHADHDNEIEMTLFISPTTNRPEMRGFTCAKHRQMAMADGWTVKTPNSVVEEKPAKKTKVAPETPAPKTKTKKAKTED